MNLTGWIFTVEGSLLFFCLIFRPPGMALPAKRGCRSVRRAGSAARGSCANIMPRVDILFGTYRWPDQEPESFGIQEGISRSYLGRMPHRFRLPKCGVRFRSGWQGPSGLPGGFSGGLVPAAA
jgi:hypothetical protein